MTEEQQKVLAGLCKQAKLQPAVLLPDGKIKISSSAPLSEETLRFFNFYDWECVESGEHPLMTDRPDEMKYEHYAILRPTFCE